MLESGFRTQWGIAVEPANSGLAKIMRDLLERAPAQEIPVLAWPLVCGEKVAHRARALIFGNGVLYVQVPDKEWKAQLIELAPQYVAALNSFKCERVRRIEFLLPGDAPPEQV